ncbi:hypothetical protein PR202_gb05919 [Eleusine coracana subsp. coracana]|uniref:RNA-dependent RNA polymerase n=1 Tax=Eleusine coracana subsp. coracana TaxID=191504 RepID=A0AAV5E875_ELECO|nr:hypothetical protein PR202_gb05919 [Eleusine coracana subsp. coracana]
MQDLFFCVQHVEGIKFPVLFLVNALVHKGVINQHQLTPEFYDLLKTREDDVNLAALREFWGDKSHVFDACKRLKRLLDRVTKNLKLLHNKIGSDNTEVRRLVITPTKAYCLPPEVERSNRVIRHYHEVADRFLRVAFMDDGMQVLNSNVLNFSVTPIVKDLMTHMSQQKTTLRDRSAWFFAEDSKTTVESIRKWMGRFTSKNITPDLAMEVAKSLPLTDSPPSAYQIRYAGFKGVIAVWEGENDGIRLSLRPSMHKFESMHTVLEEAMLSNLNNILSDTDVAFEVVTSSCPEQGNTAALMLSAGFSPGSEPHLKAMLLAIRSAQLQGLLEKTRIFVPKGRWLMGCLDELGILEQGQCFIRASAPSLSNCFVKHGPRFSSANKNAETIVGTVVMAKNPCLHPGDV